MELNIEHIYDLLISSVLIGWFICTLICQFRSSKLSTFIKSHLDCFGLVPLWTFFAPNPGKKDYHILFRDKNGDEIISEWEELEITEERSAFSWLWNPEKRDKKILSDVVQNLVSHLPYYRNENQSTNLIMFSMPYIIILNVLSHYHRRTNFSYRQFMLAESSGYLNETGPSVILLSVFHKIQ
ncbi:hypothetical protein RYH73_09005 [Olivibacter sp. CPCC 100613]|uniref:hypothetical protein n=1 Tax=Olivibacter sp. CPCC 100613 TaxID=3079931 RepID=UPI002FF9E0A2